MSGGVPAGWYPDPAAPDTQRYWDGEQWVGAPVPVDEAVPATPPAHATVSQPGAPAGQEPARLPFPAAVQPVPDRDNAATPPHQPNQQHQPDQPYQPDQPHREAAPQAPHGMSWDAEQALPELGLLAPPVLRLLARLLDVVAVGILAAVVNSYFFVQYYREMAPQLDAYLKAAVAGEPTPQIAPSATATRLALVITLTSIALWFAYEVPATANSGQTLGKRLVGIRVTRLGGLPMSFWQSTRRWLVMGIPALLLQACALPLQMIDCLWCTWDRPLQQCLHDKGVQTVVVMSIPQGTREDPKTAADDWRTP